MNEKRSLDAVSRTQKKNADNPWHVRLNICCFIVNCLDNRRKLKSKNVTCFDVKISPDRTSAET